MSGDATTYKIPLSINASKISQDNWDWLRKRTLLVEYGAPNLEGLSGEERLKRTATVDETRVCSHITYIYSDGDVLMADVQPTGPLAQCFIDCCKDGVSVRLAARGINKLNSVGPNEFTVFGFDLVPDEVAKA